MFNNKSRRRNFRSNNSKPFRRRNNGDGHRHNKSPNAITSGQFRGNNFKGPQNAGKLIEKYNLLAKEALSVGDISLAENYLQHADHYARISAANAMTNNSTENKENSNLKEVQIVNQEEKNPSENVILNKEEKE
jgi:hypothetical protein